MNKHELCPTCKPYKRCLFKAITDVIVQNVPLAKKQTPLTPDEKATQEALNAHKLIALHRELARKSGCPNLNNVDPDYPGKKNL